jgi:hypothetical protein
LRAITLRHHLCSLEPADSQGGTSNLHQTLTAKLSAIVLLRTGSDPLGRIVPEPWLRRGA